MNFSRIAASARSAGPCRRHLRRKRSVAARRNGAERSIATAGRPDVFVRDLNAKEKVITDVFWETKRADVE